MLLVLLWFELVKGSEQNCQNNKIVNKQCGHCYLNSLISLNCPGEFYLQCSRNFLDFFLVVLNFFLNSFLDLCQVLKFPCAGFKGCVRYFFVSLFGNTWETRENVFCFTSKALFVLEKIKF